MADMDSGGSRNRQSPTSVRRNTAPRPPSVHKPPPPRRVVARKKTRSSSSNNNSNYSRNSSVTRRINRSSSSRSTGSRSRKATPSSPPPSSSKQIVPPAPPKPVPPPPPGNATFLRSDSTYQKQMAAYAKALADFQADQGLARTDYETGYQQNFRDIGLAKGDAAESLENDYASRGLLKSSLYNTALGDLNQQYQNQYTDLSKQRTGFLDQLGQELGKYKNEQSVQQQNAMQEALRRRAEKYNL